MWEIRAHQKGWREKVAKSNAQTQGRWVASHCLRDSKLCCSGDKGYDGTSSDIWSCGVIIFVLMAGYLPFDEPSLIGLYKKRITISEILEDEWFKKGYKPSKFEQDEDMRIVHNLFNLKLSGTSRRLKTSENGTKGKGIATSNFWNHDTSDSVEDQ
ncbi:hypothetical protein PVK06_041070 [Gossypium arboreum]|uniref:Uncharacterized protein n=1 Tax=Gossypium arboreum TaxID=29729 RepID=A0ABR0NA15_GOSAR|nr:hypothetical protein PVK06_041070 [Gossypium arboreum]